MIRFKGAHFVKDIILTWVRWYLAYPLSYRQVEELMGYAIYQRTHVRMISCGKWAP
jgi:transposase-like protein